MTIAYDDLVDLLRHVFERHGCAPNVAAILAENCAGAERDGAASHGLFRVPGYVSTLASGWVDGRAIPVVEDAAPGVVRVDAAGGFTLVAAAAGRALLLKKVRANGVALMAIRNSHHLGALAPDVEPFAREGLVALSVINSMKSVAPHSGRGRVLGTNPIAFAAPRAGGEPLVFDQATSAMSHGDVQIHAREGRPLPEGAGVDREGHATRDAQAVLDGGALLPFGGHKGSALSMMVEILCAALVGGKFSSEVDLSQHPGAATPHTGQTILVIDPGAGAGTLAPFAERVEYLVETLREAGQARLPGDRRLAARARSAEHGIEVDAGRLAELRRLAGLPA